LIVVSWAHAVPANRATPNNAALTLANIVFSSIGDGWRR
jgi:hypothetical protein